MSRPYRKYWWQDDDFVPPAPLKSPRSIPKARAGQYFDRMREQVRQTKSFLEQQYEIRKHST